jgi:hypothetical protein
MLSLPRQYEVHLRRPDGRLTLRMFLLAANDAEARARTSWMMRGEALKASLWRDDICVASLAR